jgi:hypothetical protein
VTELFDLDQRQLSVRLEAGHAVLVRWHEVDGQRVTRDLVRLSLKEIGMLACFVSESWADLCLPDQLLRASAVASIIGGACPPLLEAP